MESTMNVDSASSSLGPAVIDAGPAPETLRLQEVTPLNAGSATEPIGNGSELDGGSPSAELLAAITGDSESNSTATGFTGLVLDAGAAPF